MTATTAFTNHNSDDMMDATSSPSSPSPRISIHQTASLNNNNNGSQSSRIPRFHQQKRSSIISNSKLLASHDKNRRKSSPHSGLTREWSLSTIHIGPTIDSDNESEVAKDAEEFFQWKRRTLSKDPSGADPDNWSTWERILNCLLFCRTRKSVKSNHISMYRRLMIWIWNVFEQNNPTLLGKIVNGIIVAFVILSTLIFVVQTEPLFYQMHWLMVLTFILEQIITVSFIVEYLLRLLSCTVHPYYRRYGWLLGRIRYMISIGPLIDLIAIIPSLISIIVALTQCAETPSDPDVSCFDYLAGNVGLKNVIIVRILRFSRLGRLPKLEKHFNIFSTIKSIILKKKSEIVTGIILLFCAVFFVATGIYLCEKDEQPDDYGSIIRSFYFTLIAVSSIGLGDVYPKTVYGRIFTCGISILAVIIMAVLTSVLGAAFLEHISEVKMREVNRMKILHLELFDIVDAVVQSEKHLHMPLNKDGSSDAVVSYRRSPRVHNRKRSRLQDHSIHSSFFAPPPRAEDEEYTPFETIISKRHDRRRTERELRARKRERKSKRNNPGGQRTEAVLEPGQICCPHCKKGINLMASKDGGAKEDETESISSGSDDDHSSIASGIDLTPNLDEFNFAEDTLYSNNKNQANQSESATKDGKSTSVQEIELADMPSGRNKPSPKLTLTHEQEGESGREAASPHTPLDLV